MKPRTWMWMPVVSLFAALAMPVGIAAQDNPSQDHKTKHQKYKLIDMGTLGGPNSVIPAPPFGTELTNGGSAIAEADTATPDPYAPNCLQGSCLVNHGFRWKEGVKTDLGALPGVNSSFPNATNERGQTVGGSENGLLDPLTGFPEFRAVLWQRGKVIDLGTFGGSNSIANSLNSGGQVVGGAQNAIPDSFGFCNQPFVPVYPTQVHAFSWQQGVMRDLGTLGGDDSCALYVNEQGQVAGFSYTNSIPNPNTGIPTLDPFLWERGKMKDLGTLGGAFAYPNWLNNRGQIVGQSDMAGDATAHPFFWDRGVLTDIGTLGGDNGTANWINEAGQVVGTADLADGTHHAFVWWKGKKMTDLGTIDGDGCSNGLYVNSSGQTVGTSTNCHGTILHTFLWEHGSMIDLGARIQPGSELTFTEPFVINDRGEIAGNGVLTNGDVHAALLIPDGDCDDDCEGRIAASQNNAAPAQSPATMKQGSESPANRVDQLRNRLGRRYHTPGQPAAPRD